MLIVFRSKAAGSITMFGAAATRLLELMGQSGVTPGAIQGPQVEAALTRLRAGLAQEPPAVAPASVAGAAPGQSSQPDNPVPLSRRAVPLIELLERSAAAGADVVWEHGA